MLEQKPLVSVILLCYRNASRIRPSINSVLQQDYPALELVISDDGSADFNEADIRAYIEQERTPNLRNYIILHSTENKGTVRNLRAALDAYTGDYYINMGADDRLAANDVISAYIDAFDTFGFNTLLVSGQMAMANEECTVTLNYALNKDDILTLCSGDSKRLFSRLSHRCLPATVATCYSRAFDSIVEGRDTAYRYSEDHHTFQRMARKGIVPVYINRITAYHPAGGVANGGSLYDPQVQESFRADKLRMWKKEIYPYWDDVLPADRKLHRKRLKLDRDNYILNSRFRSVQGKMKKLPALIAHPLLGLLHLNDVTLSTRGRSIEEFRATLRDLSPMFLLALVTLYVLHFAVLLPPPFQQILESIIMGIVFLYALVMVSIATLLALYAFARWRFRKRHN